MSYQSTIPSRGDGPGALLRAEWTKLRTVRGTGICVLLTVALTVLLSVLLSNIASTDPYTGPRYTDAFGFVHRQMTGDGTVTARIASQRPSQEWAKAGPIIKAGTDPGATYAALLLTPGHGLRLEAAFSTSIDGGAFRAPQWLRLRRTGDTITGFDSADGRNWRRVGSVTLKLPPTVQVGLAVTSPPGTVKVGSGSQTGTVPTIGRATFDNVSVRPGAVSAGSPGGAWRYQKVGASATGFSQSAGTFTVTGSGDIAGFGTPSFPSAGNDDIIANSLAGVQAGLVVVLALGVIVGAGEYRTALARTTFTASPRRGQVLAARTIVLATTVFVTGLAASASAYLAAQPGQHKNGFVPPAYPHTSLTDPLVLRAVLGSALLFAVAAVLGLAIGTLVRRPAPALILVLAAFLVPQVVGSAALSVDAQKWLDRLTPVAGLAIQQTRIRFDTAISPWGGFAVVCGYAAVALIAAAITVRRRDA